MPAGSPDNDADGPSQAGPEQPEPSLSDRLGALIGRVRTPQPDNDYVADTESHEYIHEVDPDPDPDFAESDSQWEEAEYVIGEAGLKQIQENLGFYLVTVGMTLEMIDPYCGSVAAAHADDMIENWSKVISHYPGVAKHFLNKKGGIVFAWINALQATWPLLYAIYEHHLGRTVEIKDGIVYRRTKRGAAATPNPTMPPMPNDDSFNYSVR